MPNQIVEHDDDFALGDYGQLESTPSTSRNGNEEVRYSLTINEMAQTLIAASTQIAKSMDMNETMQLNDSKKA